MYSEDGGASWTDHRPGAQRDVHTLAWHQHNPHYAYEAGGGGAAWSNDGGKNWQAADDGRSHHYTWGLAVDHQDPNCWYISACPGPYLAHSSENAQAYIYRWREHGPWQILGGGLPQPLTSFPYALLSTPDHLYAGLRDGSIYASNDGGDHWQLLSIQGDQVSSVLAMVYME